MARDVISKLISWRLFKMYLLQGQWVLGWEPLLNSVGWPPLFDVQVSISRRTENSPFVFSVKQKETVIRCSICALGKWLSGMTPPPAIPVSLTSTFCRSMLGSSCLASSVSCKWIFPWVSRQAKSQASLGLRPRGRSHGESQRFLRLSRGLQAVRESRSTGFRWNVWPVSFSAS